MDRCKRVEGHTAGTAAARPEGAVPQDIKTLGAASCWGGLRGGKGREAGRAAGNKGASGSGALAAPVVERWVIAQLTPRSMPMRGRLGGAYCSPVARAARGVAKVDAHRRCPPAKAVLRRARPLYGARHAAGRPPVGAHQGEGHDDRRRSPLHRARGRKRCRRPAGAAAPTSRRRDDGGHHVGPPRRRQRCCTWCVAGGCPPVRSPPSLRPLPTASRHQRSSARRQRRCRSGSLLPHRRGGPTRRKGGRGRWRWWSGGGNSSGAGSRERGVAAMPTAAAAAAMSTPTAATGAHLLAVSSPPASTVAGGGGGATAGTQRARPAV